MGWAQMERRMGRCDPEFGEGHEYGEWSIYGDGLRQRRCTKCGDRELRAIPRGWEEDVWNTREREW